MVLLSTSKVEEKKKKKLHPVVFSNPHKKYATKIAAKRIQKVKCFLQSPLSPASKRGLRVLYDGLGKYGYVVMDVLFLTLQRAHDFF